MIMARWSAIPARTVDLRFVEKSRLEQGKVMLYRAHRDVHLQLPADEMSVSINIVETSHSSVFRDQYRFDVEQPEGRRHPHPHLARADARRSPPIMAARRAWT